MNDMVKIVRSGGRKLVELPEDFRIEGDQIRVVRMGNSLLMEAPDAIDEETGLPLSKLRALIQEGIDSGPPRPIDMERVKQRGRERLAKR